MRFMILGSKEYPVGSSAGFDPITSGGFETYTQHLAAELVSLGHGVTVVSRRFGSQKKRESLGGVDVCRVPWIPGFFLRTPSFVFFSFLQALFLDFDVVLAQGPLSAFMAFFLKLAKNKPIIARPAGIASAQPQYSGFLKTILSALERFSYRHADFVVFLSVGEQQNFEKKLGFLPKKHAVITTGVEVAKFANQRYRRNNRPGRIVLFVGRLIAVKGVAYLIRAMKGIRARLWIVGDGPQRKELEELADKEKVDADFFGHRKNVHFFLQRAGVFVLPSISEGLPIALLEAYAAGLPCVVTDIGLPAQDGKTALVVPKENPKKLKGAITRVLNDSRLSRKLSQNARALAKTFNWKNTALGYVDLAHQLVTGKQIARKQAARKRTAKKTGG